MNRFIELDILRGLAVIGMIIFHAFFIMDFLGIRETATGEGVWRLLARFVQFSFIGLVGVSLAIAKQRYISRAEGLKNFYKKEFKRVFVIGFWALIISIVTYLAIPDVYVRFGILHLIALGIAVFSFVAERRNLNLILGFAILIVSVFINGISVDSEVLAVLGFQVARFYTVDVFPIFPWMSLIAFGAYFGNVLYNGGGRKWKIPSILYTWLFKKIAVLGRHSLGIYVVHLPVLVLIFFIIVSYF